MPRTTRRPGPAPTEPGLLSIGALARATGIPVQTLRTWERRYRSPQPTRKPSGHRLYPVSLVERLRKVAQLLERGHRSGEVLPLTTQKLDSLLSLSDVGPSRPATEARTALVVSAEGVDLTEMMLAVKQLDREDLLGMLRRNWIRLGPLQFLQQCAGRLMEEVGAAWEAGTMEIRHEHFATACLVGFLRDVREPFDRRARGPRVIVAMLPGDLHEGGLLMVSVILAMRGCRLIYLGPDTPIEQIAAAAREREPQAVALSISASVPARQGAKAISALRGMLSRRMALWVGGAGAPKPSKGVRQFRSLEALDEMLATTGAGTLRSGGTAS